MSAIEHVHATDDSELVDVDLEDIASGLLDKVYVGIRHNIGRRGRGVVEVVVKEPQCSYPLPHPCTSPAECRSPDGFEWGYGGSGPSELARCILWDHLNADPPPALFQDFKADFLVRAPFAGFEISAHRIANWLGTRMKAVPAS